MESLIEEEQIDRSSIIKKTLVFFIIFLLIFWFFSSKIKIGSLLGLGENKSEEVEALDIMNYSKIPDSVSQIVFLNLKVSKSYVWNITLLSNSLVLYVDSVSLLKQNTLELLDGASNKSSMLLSHTKDLQKKVNLLWDTIEEIRMFSQEEKFMKDDYFTQKTRGDSMFFDGLQHNDMDLLSEGLELSYKKSSEYIKHRVLYTASYNINKKLSLLKEILEAKVMLLENNEDIIVNNFDLIKDWDLAKKIIALQKQFQKYEFSVEEE